MDEQLKFENPISINLSHYHNILINECVPVQRYELNNNILFAGEHYGFIIICDTTNGLSKKVYKTNNKLLNAYIDKSNETLIINEENKEDFWQFDMEGNQVNCFTKANYPYKILKYNSKKQTNNLDNTI